MSEKAVGIILLLICFLLPDTSYIYAETNTWPVLTEYKDGYLNEIAFPVGGIGTGTVSLGGRGNLRDWEIMNTPSKGFKPTFGFFTLRTQKGNDSPDTRVLEGILKPPYSGATGYPDNTAGLPRFHDVVMKAAYPLGSFLLSDPKVPLNVTMNVFNPLIPLDADKSGLPIAVFRFELENSGSETVKASIAGSLSNFIGNDGVKNITGKYTNEFKSGSGFSGLLMSSEFDSPGIPQNGTIALITNSPETSHRLYWPQTGWWRKDLLSFWDDFSEDGALTATSDHPQDLCTGSISGSCEIPPGEKKTIDFYLVWHFPNRTAAGCGWSVRQTAGADSAGSIGNYYTSKYSDAWDAAVKIIPEIPCLEKETVKFVSSLCNSTLPQYVKEAVLNNVSTLRTQNCFRTPDGHFFGFEGTNDKSGCCFGNCTHVWNYETVTPFLFPELARTMRNVENSFSTFKTGAQAFRTQLPLFDITNDKAQTVAADGQMGGIMKLYREWRISGDNEFLKTYWPKAKIALSYAWLPGSWDENEDGVMEGVQHNTYDVEFFGPNPMIMSWYMGALRCSEKMALAMNDKAFASKCNTLYTNGGKWMDENLFNGEYYFQKVIPVTDKDKVPTEQFASWLTRDISNPDFQVGNGCLIDQLVGQYSAYTVGIGDIFEHSHLRKTAESIFKYNYKTDLFNHFNNMRTFAMNDESAVLICSWPHGDRPKVPFIYFSEVMTGFEYQAASLMIYQDMTDNGLKVIESIRARYDGMKRNPWDEAECGHHYARAMASWSSLLALSGFDYSGIEKSISFSPRINEENFNCFWSAGTGWGEYSQKFNKNESTASLKLLFGTTALSRISVPFQTKDKSNIAVSSDGKKLKAKTSFEKNNLIIEFAKPFELMKDNSIEITLTKK